MRAISAFVLSALALAVIVTASGSAQDMSDPYEILNRSFRAAGGLDRLLAEQTSYATGSFSLGGMEGSIDIWIGKPGRNRVELALGPFNIIQGDNGEYQWTLDQNGKLQVITNPDEPTLNRRQVRRLLEEYAFAERGSAVFAAKLEGIEQVDGKDCYVIKITNNINTDSYTIYVNTQSFMQEKAIYIEDNDSRDVFYSDYREVDGILIPFTTREVSHQTGQAQKMVLTQYVSNPEIDPGKFEPPAQTAKDYEFVEGDRAEDIPFEFIENHIFIPVTVKGEKRIWILDTGASMTVLNKSFAEELGLPLEGEMKGQGAGGTVEVSFATLPPFQVSSIQFQEQTAAVIDMTELIRLIGVDVVGILGFDFLSRFVTRVDFANELVSFYEPETFEYAGDGHVVDMHLSNSLFTAEATLDGAHAGSWLFDLGAGTTHLDAPYAQREGYADRNGVLGMGHGAGNEFQVKHVKCDSLQFAGFTVYEPHVSFSYGGTDTAFVADQIGVLGNSLFRNFVLYCDYSGERLIVEAGDKFNQPWPEDHCGLQIAWRNDHEVEVIYVSPDTPAEKAGFLKGDLLRSIDDDDVAILAGPVAIRKLFKADPGTEYDFVIYRAGDTKKLKLTLAELF